MQAVTEQVWMRVQAGRQQDVRGNQDVSSHLRKHRQQPCKHTKVRVEGPSSVHTMLFSCERKKGRKMECTRGTCG